MNPLPVAKRNNNGNEFQYDNHFSLSHETHSKMLCKLRFPIWLESRSCSDFVCSSTIQMSSSKNYETLTKFGETQASCCGMWGWNRARHAISKRFSSDNVWCLYCGDVTDEFSFFESRYYKILVYFRFSEEQIQNSGEACEFLASGKEVSLLDSAHGEDPVVLLVRHSVGAIQHDMRRCGTL